MAKSEALAEVDLGRSERLHQDLLDKPLRREGGQRRVEGQDDYLPNSEEPQPLHLLCKGLEQWRRGLRLEYLSWVRVEGDDRRHHPRQCRPLDDHSDDGLVAEVQPIEDAEGGDRGPLDHSLQFLWRQSPNNLHRRPAPPTPCSSRR